MRTSRWRYSLAATGCVAVLTLSIVLVACTPTPDAATQFKAGLFQQSFKTFAADAAAGDVHAQNWLGIHYYLGAGVPRDFQTAAAWFERAALGRNADAQKNLGIMYLRGLGVPQDRFKAYGWLFEAYQSGSPSARAYLASMGEILTPNQMMKARSMVDDYLRQNK